MKFRSLKKSKHNKILLVMLNQPLTRHTYKRFGLNTSYKNWKIIYWNILPIINRKLDKIFSRKGHRLKEDESFTNINSFYRKK